MSELIQCEYIRLNTSYKCTKLMQTYAFLDYETMTGFFSHLNKHFLRLKQAQFFKGFFKEEKALNRCFKSSKLFQFNKYLFFFKYKKRTSILTRSSTFGARNELLGLVGFLVLGGVAEAEVAVPQRDGTLLSVWPDHFLWRLRGRSRAHRGGSGGLLVNDGSRVRRHDSVLAVVGVGDGRTARRRATRA